MVNSAIINTRIDPVLKAEAENLFAGLGLNLSDAIRIFLTKAVAEKGLPFEVKQPNKTTMAALKRSQAKQFDKTYSDTAALFAKYK